MSKFFANGNIFTSTESGISYTQQWDKENRLQVVTNTTANPDIITTFFYNGDGARVKKTEQVNTTITTTFYAGAIEVLSTTQLITKTYYSAGGQMIAIREVTNTTGAGTLTYLHSDHLGSTSTTTCGNATCGTLGAVLTRQSYYPYGGVRQAGNLPTDITFTGQRSDATGLMHFGARYLSPSLGRFISADTIVPGAGNPQGFNRYAYSFNNPLRYIDPTGHTCEEGPFAHESCDENPINGGNESVLDNGSIVPSGCPGCSTASSPTGGASSTTSVISRPCLVCAPPKWQPPVFPLECRYCWLLGDHPVSFPTHISALPTPSPTPVLGGYQPTLDEVLYSMFGEFALQSPPGGTIGTGIDLPGAMVEAGRNMPPPYGPALSIAGEALVPVATTYVAAHDFYTSDASPEYKAVVGGSLVLTGWSALSAWAAFYGGGVGRGKR